MNRFALLLPLLLSFSTFFAAKRDWQEQEKKGSAPWETRWLTREFHAEGAGVGDIDGDGTADLSYGPFWWAGPDYSQVHRFAEGGALDGSQGYANNFFSHIVDADRDGDGDILVIGFPGQEARLYRNPGPASEEPLWEVFPIAEIINNESPHFVDLAAGGLPELVCSRDGEYGYYQAGEDPFAKWKWQAISEKGDAGGRYEHGLGVGDMNSDGLDDVVASHFWFENPGTQGLWKKHRWNEASFPGGSQILVHDYDGDGDSDVVTSLAAHGYGLSWFEQTAPGQFTAHAIMGESSTNNPFGVCFSQTHAMARADIDGDGREDFVTGKRYYAHQGKDPGGLEAPVLYWFRNTPTKEGIEFVPHLVDQASGVGVEIKVADLNDDQRPDLITSNKHGLALHFQKGKSPVTSNPSLRWKVPAGRPQEDYGSNLTPEEARDKFELPDGFTMDLIAAEPEITQPIAITFDARGRLWVLEGRTYPERAPEGKGQDRVVILEDKDGNGSFESRTVFAENLNLASGIAVGFGGVYVGAAPHLLFLPDRDQDDRPDGPAEILLDGWGYQDTHETLNSFTWGPDGWLYGCHGVFTHSLVGKPGTADEDRTPLNAAVWRYHPESQDFEIFAHGTSNPWGLDFDEHGEFFISACVIPHFYHLSPGGRYQRQAGQHFEPWVYDDIKTIADHAHYAGKISDHAFWGDNFTSRPAAPADTSALGGGHAHCGLVYYDAPEFPPAWRRQMFFHNLHGHRIVSEAIEKKGSGYIARHRPDFALSHNHQFVGVALLQGPDGALYFSDWVDSQTCHHRDVEIWDRSNGRIFRARYGDAKNTTLTLPSQSDSELVITLAHPNSFHARQAQRLLQERKHFGALHREETATALEQFEHTHAKQPELLLRALWARHVAGLLSSEQLRETLAHRDETLRAWAVRLAPADSAFHSALTKMARNETSLRVRRSLASKLQSLPEELRWSLAEGLSTHELSAQDSNIPLLVWYGLAPLLESDPERALALGEKSPWPRLRQSLFRRATEIPAGRSAVMSRLSRSNNAAEFTRLAGQLLSGLAGATTTPPPQGWQAAKEHARTLGDDPALASILRELGTRFGDEEFFPQLRALLGDETKDAKARLRALELLTLGADPKLAPAARRALSSPPLQEAAVAALRDFPGPETARALVAILPELSLSTRHAAINTLASRADMALILLTAIDEGDLDSALLSPVMLDQFERFENEALSALIARNWSRGQALLSPEALAEATARWEQVLSPDHLAAADASRGREVFDRTCGTCHQLFGEGIALGPDLTGSNRADLGYLLENVLAPGAIVGKAYQLNIITLADGSTLSGMVTRESAHQFELTLPGGTTRAVAKDEVTKREELTQSLMPAGLFETLEIQEVTDLVKYLASSQQVPLPSEKDKNRAIPKPAPGVIRLEGEDLVSAASTEHGQVSAQGMGGFSDHWSGDSQLWWRGANPGAVLTLKIEDLAAGTKKLILFPTTARDYATVRVVINGQIREVDLYTTEVKQGLPLYFPNVTIAPKEPLQIDIHLTGKNAAAAPGYMFGLDRIEIEESRAK
ncbi:PVC-type heme-binding CxxCH protein [Roseibacillus ishigakijimensis]|uniref:VCBS repeat-containing protein n=1 Tax=Roseibacillus ishigakijimensis TaxID=454146 RepID=A0A934RQ00_9BACT|nr:PVC-type heme-binding CxxCH protein [Roseibacillus ishigakijimensis]MBK1834850.1 VCBS repeat-containing protein [Roseibacillus ishigakijimensis]